jgi:hypothetical protein
MEVRISAVGGFLAEWFAPKVQGRTAQGKVATATAALGQRHRKFHGTL